VSHNEVIQFGHGDERDAGHSERIDINKVTLTEFLKGGFLEIRVYSRKELNKRNDPTKTIQIAQQCLGKRGYHILDNNCEHFSNFCVFNKRYSSQTESFTNEVLKKVKK
jgi:hypothetical protein